MRYSNCSAARSTRGARRLFAKSSAWPRPTRRPAWRSKPAGGSLTTPRGLTKRPRRPRLFRSTFWISLPRTAASYPPLTGRPGSATRPTGSRCPRTRASPARFSLASRYRKAPRSASWRCVLPARLTLPAADASIRRSWRRWDSLPACACCWRWGRERSSSCVVRSSHPAACSRSSNRCRERRSPHAT